MMFLLAAVLAINLSGCWTAGYTYSAFDDNPENRPELDQLPTAIAMDVITLPVQALGALPAGIWYVGREIEPMPAEPPLDCDCPEHKVNPTPQTALPADT